MTTEICAIVRLHASLVLPQNYSNKKQITRKFMKVKVKLIAVLIFLIGTQLAEGQVRKTSGDTQAGPAGPLDEGGGTPSTNWNVNANGLHVNGYTNIGIGTNLPTRKLDVYGAANTFIRVTSNGGIGSHVAGLEFKRIAGLNEETWDIVNQSALRIRKSGTAVLSLEPNDAYFGNVEDEMSLNIWGKAIDRKNGVLTDGSIMIKNKVSGIDMNLHLDANQLESNEDFYVNYLSGRNLDLVRGGGRVRINTDVNDAQLNLASTDKMQLQLINPGQEGASWRIGVANADWNAGAGKLVFSKTAGSADATMVLTSAGNVGIGLTTPSRTLQVNGVTSTKILEITGGADFAESFDIATSEKLIPGAVVSINPDNSGQLRVSDKAYDKSVAGIISGAGGIQPGMLMGQEGTIADGRYPVALTGRVYCLVDANHGEIVPGDLLTTSNTPGHAMKVSDLEQSRGAIIGKAMTSLKEGKGLVLVLVSLQ